MQENGGIQRTASANLGGREPYLPNLPNLERKKALPMGQVRKRQAGNALQERRTQTHYRRKRNAYAALKWMGEKSLIVENYSLAVS